MPPRRSSGRAAAAANATKPAKPSKLAKEVGITAQQEAEIKEAFSLFAVEHQEFGDEDDGVLPKADVRRCLISLGLKVPPKSVPEILSTLDPAEAGFIPYEPFLTYAAIHLHHKDGSEDDNGESPGPARDQAEEVEEAYRLFTKNTQGPITLAHLRRVAKELKQEVAEDVLKDMITEANGGSGKDGWRKGVGPDEFENVMRRAGVFG